MSVVGIGASAGGLESLEVLFSQLPTDLGMAYVVVQHLSSAHRSMMPELLGRVTSMPVGVAVEGGPVEPDTVTLIPPGQYLTIVEGHYHLEAKPAPPTLTLPIDRFFESLADGWGDASVAVVLSGTGSDGTRGAQRIHAAGGLVVVEDPTTARFDGMPRSAIAGSVADVVAPADEIGRYLARLALRPVDGRVATADRPQGDPVERIVQLLHLETGVDFEKYKRATVGRRVARRMVANDIADAEDYLTLLSADAEERDRLYQELLIRVTSFFRDPAVWSALAEYVIPGLVAAAGDHDVVRIWVPACSTGEEAYTLGMLVLDEIRRQQRSVDLKIFATDIDREGLDIASRGRYRGQQLAGLDEEMRDRYFVRTDGAFTVGSHLRRCVMFAHHNVARDAPFTRLDLVSCRNLFIYLNAELQSRVLGAFHFALRPGGTLVLGSSESLGDQADRFQVLDAPLKLYRAVGERRATAWVGDVRTPVPAVSTRAFVGTAAAAAGPVDRTLRLLAERFAPAAVLADPDGRVRHVFGDVAEYLRLAPGEAQLNLLEMSRAELRVAMSAAFTRALRTGQTISFPAVYADARNEQVGLQITVLPVDDVDGRTGAVVTFERSNTAVDRVPDLTDPTRVQLEEIHEELRRARLDQQRLVEQLEGSNEELQATNEEMVAANEELQATNEELQSVNEELFTLNAENTRRIHELEVLRSDLDHLLAATDVGALVVDEHQVIRRFTPSVGDFLPILERDIGRPITHLANSLGGEAFVRDMTAVITTGTRCERSIDSSHGPVLVRTIPYRTRDMNGALVTIVDVSTVKRNFEVSRRVLDALPAHVAFLDAHGMITMVNTAWDTFATDNAGNPEAVGPGTDYFAASGNSPDAQRVSGGIRTVLAGDAPSFSHEYECHAPDGTERWFLLQCTPAGTGDAVVVHFDITAQKQAERALENLATHDPLTAVLNRRGIEAELDAVLRRSRRAGRQACALMLDCDDFKRVNDRVGHAGGDAVLRTVARRIEHTLRAGDSLARIGGDEFMVLLPEATLQAAHVAAERVRLVVSGEPVAVSHEEIMLTVSVSVAELDHRVYTLEHLLDRFRSGLQASKDHGKNRVSDGDGSGRDGSEARARLVELLEGDRLGVAVQPIVATGSAEVVGAELLARSLVPPYLSPSAVFRLAREEGMLGVVDDHLLTRCLEVAATLGHPGRRHINIYPSTLLAMTADQIDARFAGRSSVEHPLVIELSEQQVLGDPAELFAGLVRLRSHGVEIALDDVGFGRTSLETLLVVEPQIVKIDAACIRGVDRDDARRRSLRRLVQVARSLGATLVAEGVEHDGELAVVEALGIEHCQGYLFAEPQLIG